MVSEKEGNQAVTPADTPVEQPDPPAPQDAGEAPPGTEKQAKTVSVLLRERFGLGR